MAGHFELEVPTWLRRGAHEDEQKWIESSHELLALVERSCGLSSLAGRSVLDMGCGTKMAKLLLEQDIPVARYAGMDVNRDVIEFLQAHVDDPRFTFHHLDVRNELYNPDGLPLQDRTELPVGAEQFDIIWLFSVFTHLEPADYRAMLKLLRRYVRDDGWLVFSLYINEVTSSGFGPVDWWVRRDRLTEDAHAAMARALDQEIRERGQEWFERELHRHVEEKGVDWLAQQIDAAPESARGAMERELRARRSMNAASPSRRCVVASHRPRTGSSMRPATCKVGGNRPTSST